MELPRAAGRKISFADLAKRYKRNASQVLTVREMAAIAGVIEAGTLDRMEREIGVDGRPLEPLSDRYRMWKLYGTTKPRLAMRRMRRAAKAAAEGKKTPVFRDPKTRRRVGGYSGKIWQLSGASKRNIRSIQITAAGARVQINTPYSGRVNDGGPGVPARPVLGMSAEDETAILSIMDRATQAAVTEG